MCNLYKLAPAATEVARLFGALDAAAGGNQGELVFPGYPGLVIASGEVRSMNWGFPLAPRSKKTGELLKVRPVNNTRADNFGSGLWAASFRDRRCLIPVSAFAEAEGSPGAMTRTWLSVPGEPVFTCAGIWRDTAEWGPAYSMVMTGASETMATVHNRMPVILAAADREQWQLGSETEAHALCQAWAGELAIERTSDPWHGSR